MAKSLGQINTVNYTVVDISRDTEQAYLDLSAELSAQLQHHVRQGNYFKVVGIDATLTDRGQGDAGGQLSGYFEYYSPTRGRCAAYRSAFAAMRNVMKLQGIAMSKDSNYDFRVSFDDVNQTDLLTVETASGTSYDLLRNRASLDGTNQLCLSGSIQPSADVFGVHNASLAPLAEGTPNFQSGFNVMGVQNTPTDFVFGEADLGYTGNALFAEGTPERIPFQLSYTPGNTDISVSLQWRPDPALFMAMAFGQIRMVIEEIDLDSGATGLNLDVAVHIAGWKSIMGNPDKPKRLRNKNSGTKKMTQKTTTTTVKES